MNTTKIVRLAAVTAAVLAAVGVQAQENKMGVSQPEVNYQAGGSPLADTPMYQSTNPKAPAMTQAEHRAGWWRRYPARRWPSMRMGAGPRDAAA